MALMSSSIGYVCLFLCALCASCMNTRLNDASVSKTSVGPDRRDEMNEKRREQVTHIKTVLSKAFSSSWTVDETRPIGDDALRSVFFFDEMHGWIGGKGTLYRTTDGGKTWLRVDIHVSKAASVTKVIFTNLT